MEGALHLRERKSMGRHRGGINPPILDEAEQAGEPLVTSRTKRSANLLAAHAHAEVSQRNLQRVAGLAMKANVGNATARLGGLDAILERRWMAERFYRAVNPN